jgi:precorrin-6B methylase 2
MLTMSIDKLLKDNPSFHSWDNGDIANFGVSDRVVKYMFSKVQKGYSTIETGSGKSTFAFLLAGCKHISISPNPLEEERIRKYCHENGIDANFKFVCDSSAEVLPELVKTVDQFDLVFIDGAHRYPYAEIDYHFTEKKLRVGGYMVVDDVQLPSVSNLYNFLKKEKNWTLETVIDHTAFFVKHSEEVVIDDWQNQGINDLFKKYLSFKQFVKSVLKPILKK